MLIKYTGRKEKYVLERGKRFVFDPVCDVENERDIKFFLDPKLKGLFIPVGAREIKPESVTPIEGTDKKPVYKCGVCGYTGKTKQALSAHMRKHK